MYWYFCYFSVKTCVVGPHQKRLSKALLTSTYTICFRGEITKIFIWYPLLSRPMQPSQHFCHIGPVSDPTHNFSGPVLAHKLWPVTDNCNSWISRNGRMTIETILWSISRKVMRPSWDSNWHPRASKLNLFTCPLGNGTNWTSQARYFHSPMFYIPFNIQTVKIDFVPSEEGT